MGYDSTKRSFRLNAKHLASEKTRAVLFGDGYRQGQVCSFHLRTSYIRQGKPQLAKTPHITPGVANGLPTLISRTNSYMHTHQYENRFLLLLLFLPFSFFDVLHHSHILRWDNIQRQAPTSVKPVLDLLDLTGNR